MTTVTARLLTLLLATVLAAGCGDSKQNPGEGEAESSNRLVDRTGQPPIINALDVDPEDNSFLLTTNKGFFRISPDGKRVERAKGTVTANGDSSPVGTFLEITVAGPGEYLGSGHPDVENPLPPYLGFMRSQDAGKTWTVVSRLGEADLHQIRIAHERLYAFDAVLGAVLISEDAGKTWVERFTPRSLVLDFVVDPKDPEYLLASTDDELFRSADEGRTWRPVAAVQGARLAWTPGGTLLRADRDGTVYTSPDRGQTWNPAGRVEGEPYKLKATDDTTVYMALADASILGSKDGGKSWTAVFRP